MSLNFAMGVADPSDREKEWGGYTTAFRLPNSKPIEELMVYPMPLINDLLQDLDKAI